MFHGVQLTLEALRYEGSLYSNTFNVKASCAAGYSGHAKVEMCTAGGGPYSLSGCKPKKCSRLSLTNEHIQYEITEQSLELPSFSVGVSCKGKQISPPRAVPCKDDDEPYSLEGCKPLECLSPRAGKEDGYVVQIDGRWEGIFLSCLVCL